MQTITLSVSRTDTDTWDLELTAQDLVGAATAANIPDPMPKHGETTEAWVERVTWDDRIFPALMGVHNSDPSDTEESWEISEGPEVS